MTQDIQPQPMPPWCGDLLDSLSAKKGCTDMTLVNTGEMGVRIMRKWETVMMPEVRERWSELVAATRPTTRNVDPRGYTSTFQTPKRRYRSNFALCDGREALSIRPLANKVPVPEELRVPQQFVDYFCRLQHGLVLVGGRSGMGKSTTIASVIERRAEMVGGKYVSVENPIEYRYKPIPGAIFMQREIGPEVADYEAGVREGMHQNPDVIIVQEILDRAAADATLAAALTGHLVVATLHGFTTGTLLQRFLDVLGVTNSEDQSNWSAALASCLQGSLIQELQPGIDGLVPIHEIMFTMDPKTMDPLNSIQKAIRRSDWTSLRQDIETGVNRHGMLTLRTSRAERVREGVMPLE